MTGLDSVSHSEIITLVISRTDMNLANVLGCSTLPWRRTSTTETSPGVDGTRRFIGADSVSGVRPHPWGHEGSGGVERGLVELGGGSAGRGDAVDGPLGGRLGGMRDRDGRVADSLGQKGLDGDRLRL